MVSSLQYFLIFRFVFFSFEWICQIPFYWLFFLVNFTHCDWYKFFCGFPLLAVYSHSTGAFGFNLMIGYDELFFLVFPVTQLLNHFCMTWWSILEDLRLMIYSYGFYPYLTTFFYQYSSSCISAGLKRSSAANLKSWVHFWLPKLYASLLPLRNFACAFSHWVQ